MQPKAIESSKRFSPYSHSSKSSSKTPAFGKKIRKPKPKFSKKLTYSLVQFIAPSEEHDVFKFLANNTSSIDNKKNLYPFIRRIFKKQDVEGFAILINDLEDNMTEFNFDVLQKAFINSMWASCPEFMKKVLKKTHEIRGDISED